MNPIKMYVFPITTPSAKTPELQAARYNKSILAAIAKAVCVQNTMKSEQTLNQPATGVSFGPPNGPMNQFAHIRTVNRYRCDDIDGGEATGNLIADFFSPIGTNATIAFSKNSGLAVRILELGDMTVEAREIRRVLGEMVIPEKVSGR